MAKEYTLTTPEDFINAWCGTQTSSFCENMCTTEAQDLLLISCGATPRGGRPRADDISLNYNTHAGAARWLQDAAVPLHRQGIECIVEVKTTLGLDGAVLPS